MQRFTFCLDALQTYTVKLGYTKTVKYYHLFLSFTLPETNGRGLLQSIEETEEFYENCKLKKSDNIVK